MKTLLLWLIRTYQGMASDRPSPCRFVPSCSTYGYEAIEQRGAIIGLGLTVRRLLRCNPWGGSGYDPVPAKKKHRHTDACTHSDASTHMVTTDV